MHCMHQKTDYACYAKTQLRKRLHTMHTETRIGVFVGLRARKCMQLGMHTKCIQVHTSAYKCIKKSKKRKIPLSTSLYCLFLYLLLFASSGIPQQTVNDFFTACFRRRWAFRAFIARLTGCPPSSRPFLPYGHRAFLRANTHFVRPIGFVAWVDDRKVVCIVCIKNATMRSMREHNSGIDCIQCIQKRE